MKTIEVKAKDLVIPKYEPLFYDILDHGHTNYFNSGGRDTTKSAFFSLMVLLLILQNPNVHALCLRKVGNTVQLSIRSKILYWIYRLGIASEFVIPTKYNNPIIYKRTGQMIILTGLDNPDKVKSIAPHFGYIGISWWEEFDQFDGAEEVRNVLQSVQRGGDRYWNFASFNPPISKNNWANKYVDEMSLRDDTIVTHNTYLDVPVEWLGSAVIKEAEFLKKTNPRAYEHEYLGIATGTGGDVFENVEPLDMSKVIPIQYDANGKVLKSLPMVETFDRIYTGIDWGYAVDPFRCVRCYYDRRKHDLYIFDEYSTQNKRNEDVYRELYDVQKLIERNEYVTADSAEPKSIADFHSYGARIRGAEKGKDSIRYGIQWLQGLHRIYIDPIRCPKTYKEFIDYEYPRDKNGDFLSVYPDKDNHSIDAVRYATEEIWKRRGA